MKYTNACIRRIERKGGPAWRCILKYKAEDGTYKQITKTTDRSIKTEAAAKKFLAAWHNEMEQKAIEAVGCLIVSNATVIEYCCACIDDMEARKTVEPSTIYDYRATLRYLKEGNAPIADIALNKLTRSEVEQWQVGLLQDNKSATVVRKALRVLRQFVRHAVELDELSKDPTLGVKPPKKPTKQPNALDAAGRERVVALLNSMAPTPLKVGIALALYGGLREGEVCGLRWKNVDLEAGVLWVRESIGHAGGGTYSKEPKTGGSRRDIPLVPQLIEILKERHAAMVSECIEACVPFTDNLYVLGYINGRYCNPTNLWREWAGIVKAYDLRGVTGERITFHDLRHTFATAAIAAGVDIKTVSSILGHTNAAMTLNIYASPDPDAKKRAAAAIGAAMARPVSKAEVVELKTGTAAQ